MPRSSSIRASRRGFGKEPRSRKKLLLAARAEERRALSLHQAANSRAAAPAGFRFAVVHPITLLEVAPVSVDADEVAQAGAAGADRRAQRFLDRSRQQGAALEREAIGARTRMNARAKQTLNGVDVAD